MKLVFCITLLAFLAACKKQDEADPNAYAPAKIHRKAAYVTWQTEKTAPSVRHKHHP